MARQSEQGFKNTVDYCGDNIDKSGVSPIIDDFRFQHI